MFSLPYTKGISKIIELVDKNKIHDIYFSDPNLSPSCRGSLPKDLVDWNEINQLKELGIELNYVVNAQFYKDYSFIEKVSKLAPLVSTLTINNPFILNNKIGDGLKEKFKIKSSVNNKIRSKKDIDFWITKLGTKNINIDRDINRDIDLITELYNYTKSIDESVEITMLVNEGCIINCPFKQMCDTGFHSEFSDEDILVNKLSGCADIYSTQLSEILKSPLVLPFQIDNYNGIVDVFKLAGRGESLDMVAKKIDSYLNNNWIYSLNDIISTTTSLDVKLYSLIEYNYNKITKNCKSDCSNCNKCDLIVDRIIKG